MTADPYAVRLNSPSAGVVVTGAARGIGLATATAIAAVGRPVAMWDVNPNVADVAAELNARYGDGIATGLVADLRDVEGITKGAEASRSAIGVIGGIVHCAGTVEQTGISGVTVDNWNNGLGLHARALMHLTQVFREDLKAVAGASIVAVSSINATLGEGSIPIYSAAKGAVLSLVHSMADELAHDGIRINAVSPGMTDTPNMAETKKYVGDLFNKRIFLGRFAESEEIARVIRFLLSDEASYMTAAEVVVDGGFINSQRV